MLPNRVSASQAIDFLHLVQNLKTSKRTGWVRSNVRGPESIADHMYRMGLMSLISGAEGVSTDRCIKLSIVHDVAEAIVGDITPKCGVSKQEKAELEARAIRDIQHMLGVDTAVADDIKLDQAREYDTGPYPCLPYSSEVKELFEEYEAGETPEALLVKDFDKLEMILQASEYEAAQGLTLQEFFDSTAGRFKTETGKAWAAEIVSRRTTRAAEQARIQQP